MAAIVPNISASFNRSPCAASSSSSSKTSSSATANFSMSKSAKPNIRSLTAKDFMIKRENLVVSNPKTPVQEVLRSIIENEISGFPVVDEEFRLVGLVSDYDLLALESVSGINRSYQSIFPDPSMTWKMFGELRTLNNKRKGEIVEEVMTTSPLVVNENTGIETAAKLLLETKYHRIPVVDDAGKLVGVITRRTVMTAGINGRYSNSRSLGNSN